MSGPIVRRYGFPNFEKIFGERDLNHGADASPSTAQEPAKPAKSDDAPEPKKADSGPPKA